VNFFIRTIEIDAAQFQMTLANILSKAAKVKSLMHRVDSQDSKEWVLTAKLYDGSDAGKN